MPLLLLNRTLPKGVTREFSYHYCVAAGTVLKAINSVIETSAFDENLLCHISIEEVQRSFRAEAPARRLVQRMLLATSLLPTLHK